MNNSGQFEAGFLSKSDCMVQYEPSQVSLSIEVHSSVQTLFERQIRQCALKTLEEFGATRGRIVIEDDGALDLVISARIEAVLRQAGYLSHGHLSQRETRLYEKENSDVSPVAPHSAGLTQSSRRVRLYMPGDQPHFAVNADFYGADILIFDLEDSVAQSKKFEARILVRRFLENPFLFRKSARAVRINPLSTEESMLDLAEIVSAKPDIVLLPKCETADDIKRLDRLLSEYENRCGTRLGTTQIMPIIETAKGVLAAATIACTSKRINGLCFGYEDFSRDIQSRSDMTENASWMRSGSVGQIDSLLAREMIVLAARAADIEPYDSSYSDINDTEGLLMSCYEARGLGFAGKSVIHPSQIPYVRKAFMPTAEELDRARSIVTAYEQSVQTGKGAIAVDGYMVDFPVVEKARRVVEEGGYGE